MAEVAVSLLIYNLDHLISTIDWEWDLNETVAADINNLKIRMETTNAHLKDIDATAIGEHNNGLRIWVQQVQDRAYDIEDVLDQFELHMAEDVRNAHWYTKLRDRQHVQQLANLIEDIKVKWQLVDELMKSYGSIINSTQVAGFSSISTDRNYSTLHLRIAPLLMEYSDVVGFGETIEMVASWAQEGSERYKLMFMVGMGGSGKTTIVKRVFEFVKGGFDCCAWIPASKSRTTSVILRSMCEQFGNPIRESSCPTEVDLMQQLRSYLREKRYVIVLDDLWVKHVWESINLALPRGYGGRVIITTRRGDIAYSCKDSFTDIHNIQPLSLESARELFNNKVFSKNECPAGLVVWAEKILRKCEGLPLAIIEIGQLLSNGERSETRWKTLHDTLESELRRNDNLSNFRNVLFVSYLDLPFHLKYCLLYLSIFPEDYTVKRGRLIRLWIAEGFIKEENGRQLEDIGEQYLKDLIQRSLVQVSEVDIDGRPRSCRLHNLMHNIVLSKSQEDKFCTVYKESLRERNENPRRISIQNCGGFDKENQNFTRTRTLFMSCKDASVIKFSRFKLLKVLHLEGASIDKFPNEIVKLLLLRYLCLSNTRISSIPKTLGKLRHLETLDLKQTSVRKLPKAVTRLDKLRHLLVNQNNLGSDHASFDCVEGFDISPNIGSLKNLQNLSFVRANRYHGDKILKVKSYSEKIFKSKIFHGEEMVEALGKLTQLRKLGIIDVRREDGKNLCRAIQMMRNLQSLDVNSSDKAEPLELHEITEPPLLHRLCLQGRLERPPVWISKLHDLIRLRLKWSNLPGTNNPIEILQDLPSLLELQLLDAYKGERLEFIAGKFQMLKVLELERMDQLKMVIMETTTLPSLQKLSISRCRSLVQVPVGIDNLTHLEKLILCDMPRDFVKQLKNGGVLRHLIHHIPCVHCYSVQTNGQIELEELHI